MDENNLGMNKLAQVIQERMRRNQTADGALVLDFGTIQADGSLKTNTFAIPIPQADYHVSRHLTLGATGSVLTQTANDGKHDHGSSGNDTHTHTGEGPHVHNVLVPEKLRSIKPGDRVLVAWVQSEVVIIDVILRGNQV